MRMETFMRWDGRYCLYSAPIYRTPIPILPAGLKLQISKCNTTLFRGTGTNVMKTTSPEPKANVLGVAVSAINLAQAAQLILEAVRQNRKGYVAVTGVHGVSEAQGDRQFRRILNSAFLNTPDGMPICWVGRCQGFKAMDRVYGPDLMLKLCAASTDGSLRHFLYGGAPGVAEALRS